MQKSCRPCENSTRCDKTIIFGTYRRPDIGKTWKFVVHGALRPNQIEFPHGLLDLCTHGRASKAATIAAMATFTLPADLVQLLSKLLGLEQFW